MVALIQQRFNEHSPLMESRGGIDMEDDYLENHGMSKNVDESSKSEWYLFLLTISIGG